MKVIKIENCFNCPLSEHISKKDKIVSICQNGSNIVHTKDEIELDEPIPNWCPLDEE